VHPPVGLAVPTRGPLVRPGRRRAIAKVLFTAGALPVVLLVAAFGQLAWDGRALPSAGDVAFLVHAARTMLVAGFLLVVTGVYEHVRSRRASGLLR